MDFVLFRHRGDHVSALDLALAISDLGPHSGARILRMELRQLAQQLARVLVARFRRLDGDLHNLVAALISARIQDALLAQPEALAVGGSWES